MSVSWHQIGTCSCWENEFASVEKMPKPRSVPLLAQERHPGHLGFTSGGLFLVNFGKALRRHGGRLGAYMQTSVSPAHVLVACLPLRFLSTSCYCLRFFHTNTRPPARGTASSVALFLA